MSGPGSSSAMPGDAAARFARGPGLLSLSLGLVLGPFAALANQQLTYVVNMWACGHRERGVMHLIPILCLLVVAATGVAAHLNWRSLGRGFEDELGAIETRSRFMAILGIAISAFCAIVILAQWLAIFVFDPCMRA
jgi:hypothetical protein